MNDNETYMSKCIESHLLSNRILDLILLVKCDSKKMFSDDSYRDIVSESIFMGSSSYVSSICEKAFEN